MCRVPSTSSNFGDVTIKTGFIQLFFSQTVQLHLDAMSTSLIVHLVWSMLILDMKSIILSNLLNCTPNFARNLKPHKNKAFFNFTWKYFLDFWLDTCPAVPICCPPVAAKSQEQRKRTSIITPALPETAASLAIAVTVVGTATTLLVQRNKASKETQVCS